MATLKVEFPQGKIYVSNDKRAYIKYEDNYERNFNNDLNKSQAYLDKLVSESLMKYVSFKSGVQEKSIKLATDLGKGIVTIGVPYAEYQAYSKKITKQVGIRGTRPFERMRSAKKESILRQLSAYSKRLNNG